MSDMPEQNPTPPAPPATPRRPSVLRSPSPRVTIALAAAMLAIGVGVGAAIGPAPSESLAVSQRVPLLLPSLEALAGVGSSSSTATQPPAITPQPTPAAAKRRKRKRVHAAASTPAAETPTTSETTTPSSTAPTSTGKAKKKTVKLPPITHVWLIELAGTSFTSAGAAPTAAPYIDGQAVPAGTLLSDSSALEASALASDTALLASTPPQLLQTIVQPPCPASSPEGEGTAGAACAVGTPGELTAADEFLKATVPTITATAPYRENGLIVITFASIASATATGLPAGASSSTLTSEPPAGVLLISPFATAGLRSSDTFNPASPKQSLEKLVHQ
jgi:hypothetical protein